jgi:hypothetical protein
MYGSSYMFRHYIAIFRERSECLLSGSIARRDLIPALKGHSNFKLWCRFSKNPQISDTVDPRVTTGLTYEQLGLRPKILVLTYDQRLDSQPEFRSRPHRVTTHMAFVSFSLSPDMRVCGHNSGQCIALYN